MVEAWAGTSGYIEGVSSCALSKAGQPVVECELGDWSAWSPCMKKNKTCGFKKGSQARLRQPLLGPRNPQAMQASQPCGPQAERRKCVVVKTPCTRGTLAYTQSPNHQRHTPLPLGGK